MNKFTKVATAASLALIAGNASAALDASELYDGETGIGGPTATTSSVLFAAYVTDSASSFVDRTFLFDLALDGHTGLHYADFVNGTVGNTSWDLNNFSEFNSYKAALSIGKLNWAVLGGNQLDQANDPSTNQDITSPSYNSIAPWGVIFTAQGDLNKVKNGPYQYVVNEAGNTGSIGGAILLANNAFTDLGVSQNIADTPATGNGSYNDTQISGIGLLSSPGSQAPLTVGAGDAAFVYVTNPSYSGSDNVLTQLGTFSLSADNILTYTSFATPVPLPAGVWLFMSGLLGLLGLKRNTRSQVAG